MLNPSIAFLKIIWWSFSLILKVYLNLYQTSLFLFDCLLLFILILFPFLLLTCEVSVHLISFICISTDFHCLLDYKRPMWGVFLWGASRLTLLGHLKVCSGDVYAMHSCTREQLCKSYVPCHIPFEKWCLRRYCRAMILGIILFQGKWRSHLSLFTPKWNVLMFLRRTWP